jgi:hypothetical protein
MTQPEALRLADECDEGMVDFPDVAAELRRLHAELERCKQVCSATSESWRADAESWNAQRDALLEALKNIEHRTNDPVTVAMAQVAIAKAEENT